MSTFRIDNPREVIREIEDYLLLIRTYDRRIPPFTTDGTYNPSTRAAIEVLQDISSLPVTGAVDYATWLALVAWYRQLLTETERTEFLENELFDLRLGDTGHSVVVLQSQLGEFSKLYPNVIRPAVTGQFGLSTAEAVRALQRNYGTYADGVVTSALWNRMQRDYRAHKEVQRRQHLLA